MVWIFWPCSGRGGCDGERLLGGGEVGVRGVGGGRPDHLRRILAEGQVFNQYVRSCSFEHV